MPNDKPTGLMPSREEEMAAPPEGEMGPLSEDEAELSDEEMGNGATEEEQEMINELTEEEKDLYLKVAGNATKLLYNESTSDSIVDALQGEGSPVEQLATIVSSIVEKVVVDARSQEGIDVPLDMVSAVIGSITEEIGETIPTTIGMKPLEDDPLSAIYLRACELLEERRGELVGRMNDGAGGGEQQQEQQQQPPPADPEAQPQQQPQPEQPLPPEAGGQPPPM